MNRRQEISRRALLRRTAGLVGAAAFPYIVSSSALGNSGGISASNRITIGCIGVGGRGTGVMQALLTTGQTQVVGICDVDSNRCNAVKDLLARKYKSAGCASCTDFREIVARDDIDAVMIATPDHWHALSAIEAAKAGKAVYCEKPLALTVEQGRKMVEAAHRYGIVFQTGTQHRSEAHFRRACELARNGRIGKLHTVEVEIPGSMSTAGFGFGPPPETLDYDMWLGPAPEAPYSPKRVDAFGWRWILDYAGGCVTDWGAHHIDIAQWGMGTTDTGPIEVRGEGVFPRDGLFDSALRWQYEARYANGVTVVCFAKAELLARGQYPNGIKFIGEKGWLFVDTGRIDAEPKSILKEEIGPNEIHLYESSDHASNFIDCIRTQKPTAAPVEQAHRSVTVCHLGNIAMRLGRKIRWDPTTEKIIADDKASRMLSRPMRSPWRL
ncbi:MAG: Gfo/Idh/MocA family oxidoreductase [Phycisphaerales bacterium]|nr:MAG: Gfo/Idh/MocA family oxidoreductase [Phycisphaerales bacterium]